MAINNKAVNFTIEVLGSSTGVKFKGVFGAKPRLTMKDRLDRDVVRRNLLGSGNSAEIGPAATSVAAILSELSVRLVTTPDWWKTSENGLELSDENVLVEIYEAAMKVEADALKELTEQATKNAEELKASKAE